ncbi:MAG TPA: hypothetical protein VMU94_09475 [Streptosporangiaceae bacterium]|nr:hypothetical protein [Streptosporangiaceae bacterium]
MKGRPAPGRPGIALALSAGSGDDAESIMARHPDLFNPQRHTDDCPPGCTTDHRQPGRGGKAHPDGLAVVRHAGGKSFGAAG